MKDYIWIALIQFVTIAALVAGSWYCAEQYVINYHDKLHNAHPVGSYEAARLEVQKQRIEILDERIAVLEAVIHNQRKREDFK